MKSITHKIVNCVGSQTFFWVTVVFFVFESLWIALSGRYPMAFDETTHLGLIQLYSHQWLPFFTHQSSGADMYGAVGRDPSYLYHYLLSFPYRVFARLVSNTYAQIVFLRTINITLFVCALIVYRKAMLFSGKASKPLVNGVMALIILTPVVPLVAAQINYDSLFILITALAVQLVLKVERTIVVRKYDARLILYLLVVCFTGSLVKYPFLPVFLGIFIYLMYHLCCNRGGISRMTAVVNFLKSFRNIRTLNKILLVVLLLISLSFFIERDGVNLIRYGTPSPECNQVLSLRECKNDGLWYRNYIYAQTYAHVAHPSALKELYIYKTAWLRTMLTGLVFAIGGIGGAIAQPFLLPKIAEYTIFVAGAILFIRMGDRLYKKDKTVGLLLVIIFVYIATLFAQNFMDYHHLGVAIGVQGRYLLPVLPFIYLIIARLISMFVGKRIRLKVLIFSVLLLCMVEGGGALVFIMRSNPTWYWPNSFIIKTNLDAQQILGHVILK